MAGRNRGLSIDYKVFEDLAADLDRLGVDLKETFTFAMEEQGKKVADDTKAAVQKANLPAKGVYSSGETEKSIVMQPKVEWSGDVGELNLGFDKTKAGAGGFLITGTPKMQPDYELESIYARKAYSNKLETNIRNHLEKKIWYMLRRYK